MKTSTLSISCCRICALCSGSMMACRKNGNSFTSFVSFFCKEFACNGWLHLVFFSPCGLGLTHKQRMLIKLNMNNSKQGRS